MALYPNVMRESVEFGGATLTLETGRLAKQASGSVLVTHGETQVLVTAQGTHKPSPRGGDFLPLTVDLVEKTYAAGRIPGGFFKREGRPSERATLMSRLIDRPLRPLFPDNYFNEVQVIATVLSADPNNDYGIAALIGASAALTISDLPWNGPIAGATVGRIDGQWVIGPSTEQLEESDCEILLAARRDGIVMVEGSSNELVEADIVEGLTFGFESIQPVLDLIESFGAKAGLEKKTFTPPEVDVEFRTKISDMARSGVATAAYIKEKHPRYAAIKAVSKSIIAELGEEGDERAREIKGIVSDLKSEIVRHNIVTEERRIDGRGLADIREIECETDVLFRTHGSALFTRGETQAIGVATLGTKKDEQRIENLSGTHFERFLLHYNFPPFSVGEARFLRSPGRREIGHGVLARRGLLPVLPSFDDFPYTLRLVSEVLESNGSSSMATVCASSMAMMQGGVPLKAPVAGIAMGMIEEGDKIAVLSDILGDEDHLGDMDFKVVGTAKGITALQMDIKVERLPMETLQAALEQAKDGRLHILDEMAKTISEPAEDLSPHAPRIFTVLINPERIRDLIGPGGKHIRGIQSDTGVDIDVDDTGRVAVAASDGEAAAKAIELIRGYTEEPEIGAIYLGTVAKTTDFGAFVTIMPGTDGLCHISELANERVRQTEDVVREGDQIHVKVLAIDRQGKIRLSRRAALEERGEEG
jgi:polyribonucleotide nucleotidyltransferase